MLENILAGELPSVVFKQLIEADPSLNNYSLAGLLQDEFTELSTEAVQAVWHWKRPGKSQGITDENLDALLLDLLKEAKYL